MKTAERILLVALELFNQQGETNVSSVEVALELDISPGNLYYHFKGKDSMVTSLFAQYKSKMTKILNPPEEQDLELEEFFYYLLMIFQVSHEFRFLYRNPAEIADQYPSIARSFRQILNQKEKVFDTYLKSFYDKDLLLGNDQQRKQIIELIGLIATQTPNYQLLKGKDINDGQYIYQSLGTILFALTPYMQMSKETYRELSQTVNELSKDSV